MLLRLRFTKQTCFVLVVVEWCQRRFFVIVCVVYLHAFRALLEVVLLLDPLELSLFFLILILILPPLVRLPPHRCQFRLFVETEMERREKGRLCSCVLLNEPLSMCSPKQFNVIENTQKNHYPKIRKPGFLREI